MVLAAILRKGKSILLNRKKSRENAFIVIFESFFIKSSANQLIKRSIEFENLKFDSYAKKIIVGVLEKRQDLDTKIKTYLKKWELERISQILIAILEISFYEILYVDDVDGPVSINEAVELAKKYFGGDGPAFVNGVLGNFLKSV